MQIIPTLRVSQACKESPERAQWLAELPRVAAETSQRWGVTLDRSFDDATCSFVAKARRPDGSPAVLKIAMPHFEGEHEVDGLLFWNGNPTVRVLAHDRALHAMLLEYCGGSRAVRTLPEPEQDHVIAGLLRRMWRTPPPPHPFRTLSSMISRWCHETRVREDAWPDTGLVRAGLREFEDLARSDTSSTLLATDLHAGNVLRAEREPWLAIDPKPFVGDPAYDATQHLLNCRERLRSDASSMVGRFAAMLDVDAERVRRWLFARLAAEPREEWTATEPLMVARALAP